MSDAKIDILMITHNRPSYTRKSLERLLATCDESMRVWLWHNGEHEGTLEVVRSFTSHPRVKEFHHSRENKRLTEPTNWLWTRSDAPYVSKVDDDCLLPDGWAQRLRAAHEDVSEFGAIGCWRFMDGDFDPALASWKIRSFAGGRRLLQNCWVEGSGYLMKRRCIEDYGLLRGKMSFPGYCKRLAMRGWIHGWLYPFIPQEHMDDPRSSHCEIRTDEDLRAAAPLTAVNFGVKSVQDRIEQIQRFAREAQTASIDPCDFRGWGAKLARFAGRLSG